MEVKAYLRNLRMSPTKVRLVVDVVRGLSVAEARVQLQFAKRHAALPVLKLLNSAVANAEHNFKLMVNDLYIKSIAVDGGSTLGRWRARAFGRGAPIRKRTSHVSIVLDQRHRGVTEVKQTGVAKIARKLVHRTKAEGGASAPEPADAPKAQTGASSHAPKPTDPRRMGSRHDSKTKTKKD